MLANMEKFKGLNYGTVPTTANFREVLVEDTPENMSGFARAYTSLLEQRNPLKFKSSVVTVDGEQVKLSEKVIFDYFVQLMKYRLRTVHNKSVPWRQMRQLCMPAWIQAALSWTGRAIDNDRGWIIIPQFDEEDVLDITSMLSISLALEQFSVDGKPFFKDAFPRSIDGDLDMMSFSIHDDYSWSTKREVTPVASYMATFCGMKLVEPEEYQRFYTVRFDSVDFTLQMIEHDGVVLE